jgi:hypothetical protein
MRTYDTSGSYVVNASRKVWLAGLGAAVVTREWAQAQAPSVFRNLVKEGTLVESRTIRIVGDRLEGTFSRASMMWQRARHTVQATVKQATGNAVTLVSSNLPNVKLPAMFAPAAAKAKPAKKRAAKTARTSKARVTKGAPRRKARTSK